MAETVVRVKDGDSLVVDSNGREVEVRLADIDTPEFNQPRGDEAREALRSLVDGKEVRLELIGGDAYRRIVAHVFVGDLDVNAELVRRGLAWVRRPGPVVGRPRGRRTASQARLVGRRGSGAAVDLAKDSAVHRPRAGRDPQGGVRNQAVLRQDDQLRGSHRLSPPMQTDPHRRRWRRDPLRATLPVLPLARLASTRGDQERIVALMKDATRLKTSALLKGV